MNGLIKKKAKGAQYI